MRQPLAAAPNAHCGVENWVVVTRSDGVRQWTFSGTPLYRYVGDRKPGDVSGVSESTGWRVAAVPCFASVDGNKDHAEQAGAIVDAAVEAGIEPLIELRSACGLAGSELAALADMPPEELSVVEDGRRPLRAREAAALANALGVPIDLLLQ
jgi:hypothetical protein